MEKTLLIASLRQRLFADRGTDVAAAFDYCNMLIDTIPGGNEKIAARTALHVLANTVANAIEALPEPLPALPDEVRISPEDNPATGAAEPEPVTLTLDRATLDQIIDARISQSQAVTSVMTACLDETTSHFAIMITAAEKRTADRINDISVQIDGTVTERIDDFIANQLDDEIQKYMDHSVDFTEIVRDELKQNISFSIEVD